MNGPNAAQRKNAALISLVRSRVCRICCSRNGRNKELLLDSLSPARKPHRKSSPLGVRPIPSQIDDTGSRPFLLRCLENLDKLCQILTGSAHIEGVFEQLWLIQDQFHSTHMSGKRGRTCLSEIKIWILPVKERSQSRLLS